MLCLIDIYSKYAWVVPWKDKKYKKGCSEFYNRSMMLWLPDNGTEMYSTRNEGKSVFAERFIRTLKSKIYKHMTAM